MIILLRDPEGLGRTLALPPGAAALASLMDGDRTAAEIRAAFRRRAGKPVSAQDVEQLVRQLDDAFLLEGQRFDRRRRTEIDRYLGDPIRPAWHAGGGYAAEPDALREQLDAAFALPQSPGSADADTQHGDGRLAGVISPHIDPDRGEATLADVYRRVAKQNDADLFVILGTAHHPMQNVCCVSPKDFDTPLGVVPTDRTFVDRFAKELAGSVAGRQIDPFADALTHRTEHSIEFQAVFLQYAFGGRRPFQIVPVLAGSFEEFVAEGTSPEDSPEIQTLVAALRAATAGHSGNVCFIAAADLAHVGRQFDDPWLLDEPRLAEQAEDDAALLRHVCRGDAAGFFAHVAEQHDRRRICGLAPIYLLLAALGPVRGQLLRYGQAVEPDGTACVTFAGVWFSSAVRK